jgi:CubicO group peptidase (beta-lactamase class C family)
MRSLLVAAALVLAGCGAAPQPVNVPTAPSTLAPDRQARLVKLLADAEKDGAYPAIELGVVTPDGLAWSAGAGFVDATSRRPIDADAVFRIGSLTKLFSGAALLSLRDAGRLDLDDPLEKTIPEIRGVVYPEGPRTPITIRMLVTHRSGFPRLGRVDYTRGTHDITEAELLGELAGLKLETTPGTRTTYSNLAMALAGVIVQRTSGERYRDYVTKHLFLPLGMTSSFWRREDVPPGRMVTGHVRWRGGYDEGPAHWRLGAMESMGGIYSSMNDMARFAKFALAAFTEGEDGGPLKKSTRREWMTVAAPTSAGEKAFGVNWIVGDAPGLGRIAAHTGSTADYSASILLANDRHLAAIVFIASGESSDADRICGELALAALGPPPPSTKSAAEVHLAELKPLLARLFAAAPTKEILEAVFAPSSKPIDERVAFYQKVRDEVGACSRVDDGTPTDDEGGSGRFIVTCEKGALSVTAHYDGGKINRILIRPAK